MVHIVFGAEMDQTCLRAVSSLRLAPRSKRIPEWAIGIPIPHAWDIVRNGIDSNLSNKRILIVGGGLTSVHLFRCAVERHGAQNVHLISRSAFNVKQFDIHPDWISFETRTAMLSSFFRKTDFNDRLQMLRDARGRGSVSPEAYESLQKMIKNSDTLRVDEGMSVCGYVGR